MKKKPSDSCISNIVTWLRLLLISFTLVRIQVCVILSLFCLSLASASNILLQTTLRCQIPKCPPNTNPSLQNLSTALLHSLLEYPHPRLLAPYTLLYTKTIRLIPIKISNKKHLVNGLGVIQYLHLIRTHVFTNQHRHRL
jgi:hypothetical protein